MKRNVALFVLIGALLLSACAPAAAATPAGSSTHKAFSSRTSRATFTKPHICACTGARTCQTHPKLPPRRNPGDNHLRHLGTDASRYASADYRRVRGQASGDQRGITAVPWSEYWNKLQTSLAGRSPFDSFWMNGPDFQVYASKGVLMDLQPMIDEDR